jgi:hypothetical protein
MRSAIRATPADGRDRIKEVDIFRKLDIIAELDRRRAHGNDGNSNTVDAQGQWL